MTSEPKNPRGFEGLNSLVSDVVIAEKKPAVEGKAAGTSPLPEMDLSSPVPTVKTYWSRLVNKPWRMNCPMLRDHSETTWTA